MKIVIFPNTPARLAMFDDAPIPHEITPETFPSWSQEELEKYAQNWAKFEKNDIVMLVEDD